MRPLKSYEAVVSWLLCAARMDLTIWEYRVRNAVLLALKEYIDVNLCGKSVSIPFDENLYGDVRLTFPVSWCLPSDDTKNHVHVHRAIKSLRDKSIEVQLDNVWQVVGLIEKPQHVLHTGSVTVEINAVVMRALLTYPFISRILNVPLMQSFSSIYSMRFYEMVVGQEHSVEYTIAKLRHRFKLEDKYVNNNDFIRRTVVEAKRELDAKSQWSFDFEPIKVGRQIHKIKLFPHRVLANDPQYAIYIDYKKQFTERDDILCRDNNFIRWLRHVMNFSIEELASHGYLVCYWDNKMNENARRELYAKKKDFLAQDNPKGYLIGYLRKHAQAHYVKEHSNQVPCSSTSG